MKINIKTTDIQLTPPIREYIYEKIGGLDKLLGSTDRSGVEARVEIGRITKHHKKGKIYKAEVNLKVSGKLLRVESVCQDQRVAVDSVKDSLDRKIRKYREKQDAKYKRRARRAKRKIRLSPLAWFKNKKGGRNKEEGI